MDGTFSIAPQMYEQLYTIHGYDDNSGWTLPAVYALLPNKSSKAYQKLLNIVVEHCRPYILSPDLVVMDYEMAAISAAEKVFPGASIQGCHFHFSQAIKRQLSTDMKIKAEESVQFALLIKSFYALAFLPPEHIEIAFVELKSTISPIFSAILEDFLNYFSATWVGTKNRPPRFAHSVWSVYHRCINELPRTTNIVEGWHNKMHIVAGCDHPNFWKFVTIIQNEQDGAHRTMEQIVAGEKPATRRKIYINLNKRLLTLVLKYSIGSYEVMDYINGIAHNMNLDNRRWKLSQLSCLVPITAVTF